MFVEEVTVTSRQGDTVVFPCRCWLGKDDSNGTIVRELIPGKPIPEELEGKDYSVKRPGRLFNLGPMRMGAYYFPNIFSKRGHF